MMQKMVSMGDGHLMNILIRDIYFCIPASLHAHRILEVGYRLLKQGRVRRRKVVICSLPMSSRVKRSHWLRLSVKSLAHATQSHMDLHLTNRQTSVHIICARKGVIRDRHNRKK